MNWGSVHGRLSRETEAAEVVNFMRASPLRTERLDAQVEITLLDAQEPQTSASRRVPCSSVRSPQPVWGGESLFVANAWFDALSLSACHLAKAGGEYVRQPCVEMGGRCRRKFLCHFFQECRNGPYPWPCFGGNSTRRVATPGSLWASC